MEINIDEENGLILNMKFDFKQMVIPASIATKISRVFACNQELVC